MEKQEQEGESLQTLLQLGREKRDGVGAASDCSGALGWSWPGSGRSQSRGSPSEESLLGRMAQLAFPSLAQLLAGTAEPAEAGLPGNTAADPKRQQVEAVSRLPSLQQVLSKGDASSKAS